MNIHFFAVKISGGGSHRTLDLKMRYLARKGHDVHLHTFFSGGNKIAENIPYKLHEYDISGKSFIKVQEFVIYVLEETKADIFHMEGSSFIWAGGKYKKNGGKVPTIAFLNNYPVSMGKFHKEYDKNILASKIKDFIYQYKRFIWDKLIGIGYVNHLDKIYFASPIIRQIYVNFGVNKNITAVLPDFVEVMEMQKLKKGANPFFGGFNILFTGRFVHDKGVDLLVKATKELSDVKLHLVGNGSQITQLNSLIDSYNLSDRVKIYDWMSPKDLYRYYMHADVFILPARWPEPFGRSVLESMAVGTPAITSTNTGSAWVLGESELTFNNGDVKDLIRKINKIKNQQSAREYFSNQVKKRALKFDYLNFAPKFEQDLRMLIS